VLTVPSSALSKGRQGYTVTLYDPDSGTTEVQPVEVGLNNKVNAEIKSGLSEGDMVVTGTAVTAAKATRDTSPRMPRGMGM